MTNGNKSAVQMVCEVVKSFYPPRANGKTIIAESLNTIIKYVNEKEESAEKYKWHDLRENPDDLPKNHDRVLFFTIEYDDDSEIRYYTGEYFEGIGFSNDDYEGYVTMGSYNNDEVLAWRYIEPFEED